MCRAINGVGGEKGGGMKVRLRLKRRKKGGGGGEKVI